MQAPAHTRSGTASGHMQHCTAAGSLHCDTLRPCSRPLQTQQPSNKHGRLQAASLRVCTGMTTQFASHTVLGCSCSRHDRAGLLPVLPPETCSLARVGDGMPQVTCQELLDQAQQVLHSSHSAEHWL